MCLFPLDVDWSDFKQGSGNCVQLSTDMVGRCKVVAPCVHDTVGQSHRGDTVSLDVYHHHLTLHRLGSGQYRNMCISCLLYTSDAADE